MKSPRRIARIVRVIGAMAMPCIAMAGASAADVLDVVPNSQKVETKTEPPPYGSKEFHPSADPASVLAPDQAPALRAELATLVEGYQKITAKGSNAKITEEEKRIVQRVTELAAKGVVAGDLSYRNFFSLSPSTPASDGQRVVVQFPAGALAAFSLDGKALWNIPALPDRRFCCGNASPVLCQGKVLVNLGRALLFFQGDRIYIRTREGVWCIGKPVSRTAENQP